VTPPGPGSALPGPALPAPTPAGAGPLVFAHRGASAALPEHTLAAYRQALADGADGLECDVRLSRDGHVVCLHDRRLDRTSNGTGPVSAHTLAELDRLDFGSWRDGSGPQPVLTLERLLDEVCAAGRPVRLLIETKHPSRFGANLERRLVQVLRRHGLDTPVDGAPVQVSVASFSPPALRRIRQLAPAVPTVQLLDLLPPGPWVGRLLLAGRAAGPSIDLVRARRGLVPALRSAAGQVYVWTVNDPADLDVALRCGVDAVITDRPAETLAHLGRRPGMPG
jgi:glycerophosphoryl diester phosphodiesterase